MIKEKGFEVGKKTRHDFGDGTIIAVAPRKVELTLGFDPAEIGLAEKEVKCRDCG